MDSTVLTVTVFQNIGITFVTSLLFPSHNLMVNGMFNIIASFMVYSMELAAIDQDWFGFTALILPTTLIFSVLGWLCVTIMDIEKKNLDWSDTYKVFEWTLIHVFVIVVPLSALFHDFRSTIWLKVFAYIVLYKVYKNDARENSLILIGILDFCTVIVMYYAMLNCLSAIVNQSIIDTFPTIFIKVMTVVIGYTITLFAYMMGLVCTTKSG